MNQIAERESIEQVIARQETYGPFVVNGMPAMPPAERRGYLSATDLLDAVLDGIPDSVVAVSVMRQSVRMIRQAVGGIQLAARTD